MITPNKRAGRYAIIRFYRGRKPSEIIKFVPSLGEAQEHCNNPATSTPKYFDGYELSKNIDRDRIKEALSTNVKTSA